MQLNCVMRCAIFSRYWPWRVCSSWNNLQISPRSISIVAVQ